MKNRQLSLGACFLTHYDYPGDNLNYGCTKKDTIEQCKMLCQDTEKCDHFVYVTDNYDGMYGSGLRRNCCLKRATTKALIPVQDVATGPRHCTL